jgi:hypothetical protein
VVAAVVGGRQTLDDLVGAEAFAEKLEPLGPIARVRVSLGRDRADPWLGPRDDRADREELGLGGDAPLALVEVAGGDRVGGDEGALKRGPFSHT